MEDVSEESETEMKKHLGDLIDKRLKNNQVDNPWFDEIWGDISRKNPVSNCKPNQSLHNCSLKNLEEFKIDSKVENVMNVAVLFSETFRNYRKTICRQSNDINCIHKKFDGQEYFNKHILNATG